MKVKEIMTKNVKCAKTTTTINEVLELMRANDISFVPVLEGTKLVGIVTDKDIILNELKFSDEMQEEFFSKAVSTIMSKEVIKINENTLEKEVYQIMKEKRKRRMPVVDEENNLTGIVSLIDLDVERMRLL